jgi:hypothetical protein
MPLALGGLTCDQPQLELRASCGFELLSGHGAARAAVRGEPVLDGLRRDEVVGRVQVARGEGFVERAQ